jgi:hypothetical protein
MLNVEQMIQQQLPQVDQQSWLYRPVKSLLILMAWCWWI